jgi:beta propeller repeat protein
MSSKRFILLVLVTVTLGFSGSSMAGSVTTQVTNNSYEDSYPRIKGDYVVWQGRNNGDWEIFLYNIATGVTTQITDNDYNDLSPQTDGSYIVWQGFKDHEWDIFLWDGSEAQAISGRNAQDASPQIANGFIVWTSEPFGDDFVGPSEVILYDAVTQIRTVLSANVDPGNTLSDGGPKINDEMVIWVQTDDRDNTAMYMYDFGNATITQNPEYVWGDSPQEDGNLNVLSRHDGHDREIFVYNDNSRVYHQVTDNGLQDRYPSISGSNMTWMGGEGEVSEIFVAFYEEPDSGTGTSTEHAATGVTTGGNTDDGGNGARCFINTIAHY